MCKGEKRADMIVSQHSTRSVSLHNRLEIMRNEESRHRKRHNATGADLTNTEGLIGRGTGRKKQWNVANNR